MSLPFADWLPQQRWYAGRGRTIAEVEPTSVTPLADDLDHMLLRVRFTDGATHAYQVVVGWDRSPADEFVGVARIGDANGRTGYDALYSERTSRELLGMILAGHAVGDLSFEAEPGTINRGRHHGAGDRRRAEQLQRGVQRLGHPQAVSPRGPGPESGPRARSCVGSCRESVFGPVDGRHRGHGRRRPAAVAGHADRIRGELGRRMVDGGHQRPRPDRAAGVRTGPGRRRLRRRGPPTRRSGCLDPHARSATSSAARSRSRRSTT